MTHSKLRVHPLFSLLTQLSVGTFVLLVGTLGVASWAIIASSSRSIAQEREHAVILLGRNIALSCEKALLRPDPELEIYPLVARVYKSDADVSMLVITDRSGKIIADPDLVKVGQPFAWTAGRLTRRDRADLATGEHLFADQNETVFVVPIGAGPVSSGTVYLGSSKSAVRERVRDSVNLSMLFAAAGLLLGLILARSFFGRIARPLAALLKGVELAASGDLDARVETSTRSEFGVLATAFNEMTSRMKTAQHELVAKERLDREFEIAREVQQTLLPHLAQMPPRFSIAHYYEAAFEVGGDFIDIVPMGGDRLGFVIADVSGKGVSGLVVMAMIKVLVQKLLHRSEVPSDVLKKLDAALRRNLRPNTFVTAFVATVDGSTGAVLASNAGHNPILVYRRREHRSTIHRFHGPPLGIVPTDIVNTCIVDHAIQLEEGDILLQYTDGVFESLDEQGRQFSLERMQQIVDEQGEHGVDAVVKALVDAERNFRGNAPQNDDIALIAVALSESHALEETGELNVVANQ
jgi:serine phosphatase RsbU (regulator of sigma subunit)